MISRRRWKPITQGEQVALSTSWWSWKKPLIHKAIDAPIYERWLRAARNNLTVLTAITNETREHILPARQRIVPGLKALQEQAAYNEGHLRRLQKHENNSSPSFLLSLATAIRVNVLAFYPPTTEIWLAETTSYLCTKDDPPGFECVTSAEAMAYVNFMLGSTIVPGVAQDHLLFRLDSLSEDDEWMVRKVAEFLGRILDSICLEPESGNNND